MFSMTAWMVQIMKLLRFGCFENFDKELYIQKSLSRTAKRLKNEWSFFLQFFSFIRIPYILSVFVLVLYSSECAADLNLNVHLTNTCTIEREIVTKNINYHFICTDDSLNFFLILLFLFNKYCWYSISCSFSYRLSSHDIFFIFIVKIVVNRTHLNSRRAPLLRVDNRCRNYLIVYHSMMLHVSYYHASLAPIDVNAVCLSVIPCLPRKIYFAAIFNEFVWKDEREKKLFNTKEIIFII